MDINELEAEEKEQVYEMVYQESSIQMKPERTAANKQSILKFNNEEYLIKYN